MTGAEQAFDQGDQIIHAHDREVLEPELGAKVRELVLEYDLLERGHERMHGSKGKKR